MKFLFILLILLTLVFAGCGAQHVYMCSDGSVGGAEQITKSKLVYHCPDGRLTKNIATCQFDPSASISKTDAEENAQNFVRGYVQANGWQTTLINAYQEEADWFVQVVLSKYEETSYETILKVDGERGSVSCESNCLYIS